MAQVILPLGYPALSGEEAQMIVYQGTVARLYVVPQDPRTDLQLFERRLLSDISKMRGAAGKWAKSSWKLTYGAKYATVIYQMVKGDVNGYWSGALAEFDTFTDTNKNLWNEHAPYGATFNLPGRVFYGLARMLFLWGDNVAGNYFFMPEPLEDNAEAVYDWWVEGLFNYGWQVQTQENSFYDDRDVKWSFGGTYGTWNGSQALNNTLIQLTSVGAWAEITIHCSLIRLCYMVNTDCGMFKVFVDGEEVLEINGYHADFEQRESDDVLLSGGLHTIRVEHTGDVGDIVNLDGLFAHLFYRLPDYHGYHGGWIPESPAVGYAYTWFKSVYGFTSAIEFNFVGSWLQVGYMKDIVFGVAEVYIDGVFIDNINNYTSGSMVHATAIIGRVPFGLHRARIQNFGVEVVSVTSIRVLRSKNKIII